jgi:hypothetical protein
VLPPDSGLALGPSLSSDPALPSWHIDAPIVSYA